MTYLPWQLSARASVIVHAMSHIQNPLQGCATIVPLTRKPMQNDKGVFKTIQPARRLLVSEEGQSVRSKALRGVHSTAYCSHSFVAAQVSAKYRNNVS